MELLGVAAYAAFLADELDALSENIIAALEAHQAELSALRTENKALRTSAERCGCGDDELRAQYDVLLNKYEDAGALIAKQAAEIVALRREQLNPKHEVPEAEHEELSATIDAFFKSLEKSLEAADNRNARRATTSEL